MDVGLMFHHATSLRFEIDEADQTEGAGNPAAGA